MGLLLLRLLTAAALIYFGIVSVFASPPLTTLVLQCIGIAAGILLLVGLWTPVTGVSRFLSGTLEAPFLVP